MTIRSQAHSQTYRPDIDGLRAIAVLGVVFFHAGLGVPGGFVGVDIFFVLSGYLITQIILRDLKNGQFSILSFWERRIRRILPALAVMVVTVLIFGWFYSLPFHYLIVGQSTVALIAIASNIQFWRTTDYFAPAAEENPLLHTWSLSVEEQFYLVVPFLLIVVFRFRRSHLVPILFLLGCLVSFVLSVWQLPRDPAGAFYLLPSRAWELGIGCLLATLPPLKSNGIRSLSSYLGLVLILGTLFCYDPSIPFPGMAALPPVFGTALIIHAGGGPGESFQPLINRTLGSKIPIFIGLSSYSFYLWHWPFFAYHRYLTSAPPSIPVAIAYLVASYLLANASLFFVERPFRRRRPTSKRHKVFVVGGATLLLILAPAIMIQMTGGVRSRVPSEIVELDSANGDRYLEKGKVLEIPGGTELRLLGKIDEKPTLLVWGDSHALASLPAIDEAMRQLGRCAVAAEKAGTAPVLDWATFPNPSDQLNFNRSVLEFAKAAKEDGLSSVMLIFYWSAYVHEQRTPEGFALPSEGFPEALVQTILELQGAGLEVILFEETPVFPVHVARACALHKWHGTALPLLTKQQSENYREVYDSIIGLVRSRASETRVFDPQALFLGKGNQFLVQDSDGSLLFKDQSHLTRRGAMRLVPAIVDLVGGATIPEREDSQALEKDQGSQPEPNRGPGDAPKPNPQ